MSKQLWADHSNVPYTCGLGYVGNFTRQKDMWYDDRERLRAPSGGTGFFVVGFINDSICRDAYKRLTKKYKLIFQSPVRYNTNSGNQFFFCIFDRLV